MRALLLAAIAALPLAAAGAPRQKVAVLDIRAVQGVSTGTASILTAIVVDDASRAGFDVISQADVSAMIGFEKQKQMLGCSEDSSCLAEIGGALGVDFVLSGQVGQIGSRYHLSFQLLDSRRGKVAARSARFSDRDEDALAGAAQATVAELLAAAQGQARVAAAPPARQLEKAPATTVAPPAPKATAASRPDLAAPPPTRAAPAVTAVPGAKVPLLRNRKVAWWTMGGGGALLVAGLVSGAAARSRYDDLESRAGTLGYYDAYEEERAGIRSLAVTADVLVVTGLAAAGAGGWIWWRSERAAVAVVPSARDGQLGLVAAGTF
jgi:TolB-like protein